MAETVLYSFRRCPYAMRARMALAISETAYQHREVVLQDKPAAMLAASPKGTVPVLVTGDGTVIDESLAIMHWALDRHDPEGWRERGDSALIDTIDGPFKHHLDRYKYATRYAGVDASEHRAAALALLVDLDRRLTDRAYLGGDERGLADIAIFPFVRQFANTDADWFGQQPLHRVKAWLAGLVASPLFETVMARHRQWQAEA